MNEVMEFSDRITVLKGGEVEDTMPYQNDCRTPDKTVVGERELKPHKNEVAHARRSVLKLKICLLKIQRSDGDQKCVSGYPGRRNPWNRRGCRKWVRKNGKAVAGLRKVVGGTITINGRCDNAGCKSTREEK